MPIADRCEALTRPFPAGGEHAWREPRRLAGVDSGKEGDELLAAPAPEGVDGAQLARDDLAEFAQGRVAGGVAEGVVDHLEVVDVDQPHGQRRLARLSLRRSFLRHQSPEARPTARRFIRQLHCNVTNRAVSCCVSACPPTGDRLRSILPKQAVILFSTPLL